jgi:chromosome partitioning protein
MIIAVINQKGGAGKTTLSVHLACYLADIGKRVAFVDNDPQASASSWLQAAAPTMSVQSINEAQQLVTQLPKLEEEFDVVVCDGSPRLNEQTHVLMYLADRILIPVLPSALDVKATFQTQQAVEKVTQARRADGLADPWVRLILNKVRSVGDQAKLVRKFLRDLGLPMASQTVGLRDAYSKAVVDDTVVTRLAASNKTAIPAAQEITNLFNEVLPHEFRVELEVAA